MRWLLVAMAALCVFDAGCMFNNISPEVRLSDTVHGFNDEVRWGRIDLAIKRVHPEKQSLVRATHRRWGRQVQIADVEVLELDLDFEKKKASSTVTYRWYRQDTMLVSETTVVQSWVQKGRDFLLVSESVSEGNAELLETPALPTDATDEAKPGVAPPPAASSKPSAAPPPAAS